MRNYFISLLLLLFCCFYFTSCTNDPYHLDVSKSDVELKVLRFDQDLLGIDISNLSESRQFLYQKYGDFAPIYFEQIIRIGSGEDNNTLNIAKEFTTDSLINGIQREIDNEFSSEKMNQIKIQFTNAFKRYNVLFPDKKIPEVIFSNTGFNIGIAVLENQISIGLDFYIGSDNHLLEGLPLEQFPLFKKEKMNSEYLVTDAVNYWVESELFPNIEGGDLLNRIIKKGKLMYLMDVLFYDLDDHILMKYTEEELNWVKENQENIWLLLGNQKVLFGTRAFDNQKWINDGPFTNVQGMPDDSPARIGVWVGWEMVNDYMEDHPEISITDLLNEEDNQKIMRSYDPRN